MIRRRLRTVPPDHLLDRIQRRLRALHARARYRLGLPESDAGEAEVAQAFRHPIDLGQRQLLVKRYRDLFSNAVQTELGEATQLAAHRFTLLGHTVDHGERIAWSCDPVSGNEWERGFSPDILYRGPRRLGDIKLPWELNKHQYFFTLGKAAWLTDVSSPALEIVRQIDHWIDDNPCYRGINWIDALQVGMRAVSWIMAYPFYADYCDVSFRCRLARSLAQHMHFVERNLSIGRFANNHLIGETAALVAGGLFLDCQRSRRWLDTGLAHLEKEMGRQVAADGVHAERSIAYHRFCLDHYYLVSGLLSANGRSLPTATRRGMESMTEFLMDVLWPDGSAPAFSDGDDARGLWFRADAPSDYLSLLALGAALFARGDFKAVAGGLTEEVLWLLGIEGIDRFQGLPPGPPEHASAGYPDGGYYIMRGGWGATDPVLVFDCGPLGYGPAGHGHADALSFQLHAGGYPFFVDPGTFSYNLDYGWRDAFRTTRAHNTVVVDGQEQSVPGDRMSWKTMASAHCHRWLSTRWFDFADGEHDGYRRLPDPVTHRRVVVFLKSGFWVVWDYLTGNGRHDLEVLLHLRPDCTVDMGQGGTGFVLRSPEGARLHTWMLGGSGEAGCPEVLVGGEEERAAWFSPGYGKRVAARALSVRRKFVGQCALMTCFSTSNQISPAFMEQDGAIRVGMRRGGERAETFFYRVHADRPLEAEDVRFDGQLLYRREMAGIPQVLWASDFRDLSVTGLLEVRSPVPIESLVLEGGHCEVVVLPEHAAGLQVVAREGIRLVINGRPAPVGAMLIHSMVVTS